ncbi:hypothetical protein ACFO26_00655 [Lactococcus nasutitermitis]|uniref:Uncharacterized protein n=1 Tax=Lactococcus nasutitermitis TaxID=1652957 RepID=A0ABV9J9V2_9LACT|nr:hypothetical protein [Lactococcus nasutitermitis]
MTVEADLRTQGKKVQQNFALASRMMNENELQMATDELQFARTELLRYKENLDQFDGAKIGLTGLIFRHPYHVPEEFKQIVVAMEAKYHQLDKKLAKITEKQNNLENRAQAREKKSGKEN